MIYLDHNASTPIAPEVLESMRPWLAGPGANPSSSHRAGREARHAMDQARAQVARTLRCREDEVVFTSGGTESNNLAILGAGRAAKTKHALVCAAEHSSVLGPAKQLAAEGVQVEWISVDSACRVRTQELIEKLRPETGLVSLMLANNEIGSVQPIAQIAKSLPDSVIFHCDAVQAVGKIAVDFQDLGVDLLSISAHKVYGPSGAGALLVRKGTALQPIVHGGGQEQDLRAGSEDVAAIVGLGTALALAESKLVPYQVHCRKLQDYLVPRLAQKFPGLEIHTPKTDCLPNTLNVSFPKMDGRSLLIQLDLAEIAVSLGSACASGSILPSHVLLAMGKSREDALRAIRFSWGWGIEQSHLDELLNSLDKIFSDLRFSS